ncbi:hypothetical protein DOY81_000549 [Sarcophaga bullata]|nr:hypothetical protein DOY81_000549 [Sarcophaga bullata]
MQIIFFLLTLILNFHKDFSTTTAFPFLVQDACVRNEENLTNVR